MGRARLWREGKLRCAKPFKFNLADVARLKVAQTGKGTAGHKLTRTYPYGRPHHLDKRNYNAKRVPRWMAAYLINYRSPLTMSITFSSGATLASVIMRRLTALVGHLLADVRYLGAHLEHDPLDAAPDRKIATRRTPRRQARQCRQGDTGLPSMSASTSARRTSSFRFSIKRSCSISVLTLT